MPDKGHTFSIKVGRTPRHCVVEMDGQVLKGVTSVSFDLSANKMTVLTLKIMGEIRVEGGFESTPLVDVAQTIPHHVA